MKQNGLGLRLTATERVPLAQRTEGQTAPPSSPPSSPLCSAGPVGRREKDQEGAGVRGQEEGVLCGRRCRTAATAGAATAATVIARATAAAAAAAAAAGAGAAVRCTHSSIHPFSLPPAPPPAAAAVPLPPPLRSPSCSDLPADCADDGFGAGAGAGLGEVNWSQHQLVPFEKNFYMEHPDVTAMTREEVLTFCILESTRSLRLRDCH